MMDSIAAIRVRAVRLPMTPHRTASGVITESPLVLIDIETSQGVIGHGLIFTYTAAALLPVKQLIENISVMLVDQPLAPQQQYESMQNRFRLLGTQGLVGMALAGLDMALWDAKVRSSEQSLIDYFGGTARSIPVYGGIGYEGAEGSATAAADWINKGIKAVKAKIGYDSIQEDVAVVEAIREVIGEDSELMVDYNQSLKPQEAIARIKAMEHCRLTWVEEPTLAHDYAGHRQIADAVDTPIQCGENWWGPMDMQHAIDAHCSDFMMPDVMKIGGVSGWLQVSAMASQRGISLSSHLWPELSAQLLCLTPTAHWLEYIDWWNPILANPLLIEDGMALVDDRPGSGIEWDEGTIARHQI